MSTEYDDEVVLTTEHYDGARRIVDAFQDAVVAPNGSGAATQLAIATIVVGIARLMSVSRGIPVEDALDIMCESFKESHQQDVKNRGRMS